MWLKKTCKLAGILGFVAVAAMPWNATALNYGSLTDTLFGKSGKQDTIDRLLVKSIFEITEGKTKQAFTTINELIRTVPNFKLAYLIRGDLLMAQGRPIASFGAATHLNNAPLKADEVQGLRDEARTRIAYYLSPKNDKRLPDVLLKLGQGQEHFIVIETSKSRLYHYKVTDAGLEYVNDYYVTVGKNGVDKKVEGDKRTPLGIYFAGSKLTQPLPDFYGEGAYPLNYPNELDQHENKSGSGIWLHGTPSDTYSRPPRASDGCVVLSNPDMKALASILQKGKTPVVITDTVEWLPSDKADSESAEVTAIENSIERWRKDWAAQNTDAYLSHYSNNFFYSDGNLQKWANYKRGIQASKPKVSVQINDISIVGLPNAENPIVVVNFEQDFRSASLKNKMRKRQYWQREGETWKIIYEGAA